MLKSLTTLMRGAAGLGKAAVNAEPVTEQALQIRRDRCARCDYATATRATTIAGYRVLSPASRCKLCKCLISAKTKLRSERCPIGQW